MAWRYLAQQALTGQLLDLDLPLTREELRWDLSGPGALRGTLPGEYAELLYDDGAAAFGRNDDGVWRTFLYAEHDGQIRWGGILRKSLAGGGILALEAQGFSSYAAGMPYTGAYYKRVAADPTGLFSYVWAHLQTQPDGNLGLAVVVPSNCPVRVGTAEEPYELAWWEQTDCGAELGQLALETPLDFTEMHAWGVGQAITHKLQVAYPRAGRKRDDLVFNPDNTRDPVDVDKDGEAFAQISFVIGKGEGAASVRGYDGVRDGRLRRVNVYTDKLAGTTARGNALARRERLVRQLKPTVGAITVNDHDNARIGSWQVGDDILVETELPHYGRIAEWHRITSWQLQSDTVAQLTLARSDTFHYGGVSS